MADKPQEQRARDWERIEADYRGGHFTDRELGAKYGMSHTAIQKRAKLHGWQKDMAGAVKAATEARLMQAEVAKVASPEVAKRVANQVAKALPVAIEAVAAAAEVNSAVILRHRADIAQLRNIAVGMAGELSVIAEAREEIARLNDILLSDASPAEIEGARRALDDLLKLHNRIGSVQKLADTHTKLQALERKAFGLDDEGSKDDAASKKTLTDLEMAARLAGIFERARQRKESEGQA